MKFKCPSGLSAVSIGGETFNVVDGIIETPDEGNYAGFLAPHGVTPLIEEPAQDNAEEGADDAPAKQSKKRAAKNAD